MDKELRQIFESAKLDIEESYKRQVRYQYNRMLEALGPSFEGIFSSWTYCRTYNGTVRPNVKQVLFEKRTVYPYEVYHTLLDEEKLNTNATSYANRVIDEGVAKVIKKLGLIENLTGKNITKSGYRVEFTVTGKRGQDKIFLEQNMIINVSSKGTVFNQWPSRIYVNGKFVSEANYKKGA